MAKTLNHYTQQIRALAPDALVLDRARDLGILLIEAKAAVQAASRKWTDWLENDCSLSSRTAQRFMTIARRWDEPAFAEAREARSDLPLREADKLLAASSNRARVKPQGKTLSQRHWQQTSLGDLVSFFCPVCHREAKGNREQTLFCGGRGLKLTCHPAVESEPHPPAEMICSCQGGFDGKPEFMVWPKDLMSIRRLPAVIGMAGQLRQTMNRPLYFDATLFEVSSCGHTVMVSNAESPQQFPHLMIDLGDDGEPTTAWVYPPYGGGGATVNAEGINVGCDGRIIGTPAGIETSGDCTALMPTWELVRDAFGWEAA